MSWIRTLKKPREFLYGVKKFQSESTKKSEKFLCQSVDRSGAVRPSLLRRRQGPRLRCSRNARVRYYRGWDRTARLWVKRCVASQSVLICQHSHGLLCFHRGTTRYNLSGDNSGSIYEGCGGATLSQLKGSAVWGRFNPFPLYPTLNFTIHTFIIPISISCIRSLKQRRDPRLRLFPRSQPAPGERVTASHLHWQCDCL